MAVIKALNVLLGADAKQFNSVMKGVIKGVKYARKQINSVGSNIGTGLAVGAAAGAAGLAALTYTQMEAADEAKRNADLLGLNVNAYSTLAHAAKLADADIETLAGGMKKLSVNLSKAAQEGGKGDVNKTLKELGLSAEELLKQKPDERIRTIADAMSKVKNPADQARIAMALFGKSGVELVSFLRQGGKAIQEVQEKANRLGGALTDIQSAHIAEANDHLDDLRLILAGTGNQLAAELSPLISQFSKELQAAGINGTTLGTAIAESMATAGGAIATVLDLMSDVRKAFAQQKIEETKALQANLRAMDKDFFLGSMVNTKRKTMPANAPITWGDTADAMDLEIAEMERKLTEDFPDNAKKAGDAFREFLERAKQTAAETRAAMDNKPIIEANDIIPDDLDDKVDSELTKLNETLKKHLGDLVSGLKGYDLEIAKLKAKGEDVQEAEHFNKAIKDIENTNRQKDYAKGIKKDIQTPVERLGDELTRLTAVKNRGLLTDAEFDLASKKAAKDILPKDELRLPSLMLEGSQAAAQAIARSNLPDGGQNDLATRDFKIQQAMLIVNKKIADNTAVEKVFIE